jgi:hypothetical protein
MIPARWLHSRNKVLALAACGLLSVAAAPAAQLQVCVQDFTTGGLTNRRVILTPLSYPASAPGWVVSLEPKTALTGADGCTIVSNLLAGTYRLTISGTPVTSVQITVPDTNTVVNAALQITTTAGTNLAAYTTAAADARFATYAAVTNIHSALGGGAGGVGAAQVTNTAASLIGQSNAPLLSSLAGKIASDHGRGTNVSFQGGLGLSDFAYLTNSAGTIRFTYILDAEDVQDIWSVPSDSFRFHVRPELDTGYYNTAVQPLSLIHNQLLVNASNALQTSLQTSNANLNNIQGALVVSSGQQFYLGTNSGPLGEDYNVIFLGHNWTSAGRGIADWNTVTSVGDGFNAYCSYDSRPTAQGNYGYNHITSFQSRIQYKGPAPIDTIQGYAFLPTLNGPATNVYAINIFDSNGSNRPVYQAGIYIHDLTNATGQNYAINQVGTNTPSYFDGTVTLGATAVMRSSQYNSNLTVLGGLAAGSLSAPWASFGVGYSKGAGYSLQNAGGTKAILTLTEVGSATVSSNLAVAGGATITGSVTCSGLTPGNLANSTYFAANSGGHNFLNDAGDTYLLRVANTGGISVGTNLTMKSSLAAPTVTGTNNGVFWASNNMLFWTCTAGGTTTNTTKIAGP